MLGSTIFLGRPIEMLNLIFFRRVIYHWFEKLTAKGTRWAFFGSHGFRAQVHAGPIGPIAIHSPRVSHFSPQVCFGRLRCSIFPPTGVFRYVTLYVTYVNLSASGWNHRGTYLPLIEEKRYLHEVQLMLGEGIEAIWAISNPNAQPWDAIRSYEVP